RASGTSIAIRQLARQLLWFAVALVGQRVRIVSGLLLGFQARPRRGTIDGRQLARLAILVQSVAGSLLLAIALSGNCSAGVSRLLVAARGALGARQLLGLVVGQILAAEHGRFTIDWRQRLAVRSRQGVIG